MFSLLLDSMYSYNHLMICMICEGKEKGSGTLAIRNYCLLTKDVCGIQCKLRMGLIMPSHFGMENVPDPCHKD